MSSFEPTDQGRLRKGSFSFYEVTLEQLERLATQRRRERDTDLQKQALHIGSLFLSIAGEPDRATGLYGNAEVEELAKQLRPWVVIGIDWLEQHGHPITTGSSSQLSALLGALATMGSPSQQKAAPVAPEQEHMEEEQVFIDSSALSTLNLDESPML